MTDQHPINPPPCLTQQWLLEAHHKEAPPGTCPDTRILIARAAQWGADQELAACCEWVGSMFHGHKTWADELRNDRRPKPPSPKEQALTALTRYATGKTIFTRDSVDIIRRALEALPE